MARSAAMAALLMLALLAVPAASADTGGHGQPAAHTVTMTLQEYTDLYKEAHLQEARRSADGEREDLRQAFERKKEGLETERARLAEAAARKSTRERVLPGNWLLLNHSAAGFFRLGENEHEEQSMAVFDFAIDFRIFDDAWTAIPLVDGRAIASGWKVLKQESVGDGNGNGSALSEFRPVDLGPEMLLVLRPVEGDEKSKDEAEAEGFKLRARFDVNKFVTSPALIEKLLAEGEAENKEYQHPAPYTPPTNFGGSKYMRYPNNGLGFSPEVCAIPPWIR